MKKPEPVSKKVHILKNTAEYYKDLGEKAAIYTFTKNSVSQKHITPINPLSSKYIHQKDDHRKSDNDITPLLSPLSRDISHLRDKLKYPGSTIPSELPPDIKSIKKILETSDQPQGLVNKGNSLPLIYKKDFSVESFQKTVSNELPSIDKMLLGPPTGRQETSLLKKWFESLKEQPDYEGNEENQKVLHIMCAKEIIRQVSVHCIERGELLHEIIEYFIEKIEKNKENLNKAIKNTEKVKKVVFNDFRNKENELKEKIEALEKKNLESQEEIFKKNKEIFLINEMLVNEREKIEELKMRLGIEDLNEFKGLRMMHKSTNITSKTRDSLFKSILSPKLKLEVELVDMQTQTEVITYTRKVPQVVKIAESQDETKINDENPEKNISDIEPALMKPNILQNSPDATEAILKNNEKCQNSEDPNVVTVCDEECQTCFALETIYYDYIEANVYIESDSLDQYEENLSDCQSDRRLSSKSNLESLLEVSKKEIRKRKSSRIKRISLNLDFDQPARKSLNPVDMNKYRLSNELEVIPDKESSEEIPAENDEKSSENEEKPENIRRKSNFSFRNFRKLSQTSSKRQKKASSQQDFQLSENAQIEQKMKELQEAQENLRSLEIQIVQKTQALNDIEKQLKKKKLALNPIKKSATIRRVRGKELRKLPTISINELADRNTPEIEEKNLDLDHRLLTNQHDISIISSRSHISSINSSFETSNQDYKPATYFKKSQTEQFLNPKPTIRRSSLENPETAKMTEKIWLPGEPELNNDEESSSKSSEELNENIQNTKREKIQRRLTRKHTNSHTTEFALFQFNRKGLFKEQVRKNPAKKIVSMILTKREAWIKKKATISRKMANKLMSTVYLSMLGKPEENCLAELLYDEFLGKYGIKNVAERKFTEFICSVASFEDSKRAKVFLRFIGAGSLTNCGNFSQESLKFYLSCLNFMINSKVGIVNYDDTLDKIMFPAARAIECIKEKLYSFDKHTVNMLMQKVEKIKIFDPKKINASGLVEGEIVLEVIIEVFENNREHIIQGVELLINCIKCEENKESLSKFEVLLIFRMFYNSKVDEAEQLLLGKDCIGAQEFFEFCLEKCLCNVQYIYSVFPDEKPGFEDVLSIVEPGVESLKMVLDEIRAMKHVGWGENLEFWDEKLLILANQVSYRKPYESLLAFKIYSTEIIRLKNLIS